MATNVVENDNFDRLYSVDEDLYAGCISLPKVIKLHAAGNEGATLKIIVKQRLGLDKLESEASGKNTQADKDLDQLVAALALFKKTHHLCLPLTSFGLVPYFTAKMEVQKNLQTEPAAKPAEMRKKLPSGLKIENLGDLDFDISDARCHIEPVGESGKIFSGFVEKPMAHRRLKIMVLLARALNRLSDNYSANSTEKFTATFGSKKLSTPMEFFESLKACGHSIRVWIEIRVANFYTLWVGKDEERKEVPLPVMLKIDVNDERPIVVPAPHTELVIEIKPPKSEASNNSQTYIDTCLTWYAGTDGIGFNPRMYEYSKWTGHKVLSTYSAEKAMKLLHLAGIFGSSLREAASEKFAHGYGTTGVCSDSVAVLELALMGKTKCFPLLLNKELVAPALEKRKKGVANDTMRQLYDKLITAVQHLPHDSHVSSEKDHVALAQRVFDNIPFENGKEPFLCLKRAKETLKRVLQLEKTQANDNTATTTSKNLL